MTDLTEYRVSINGVADSSRSSRNHHRYSSLDPRRRSDLSTCQRTCFLWKYKLFRFTLYALFLTTTLFMVLYFTVFHAMVQSEVDKAVNVIHYIKMKNPRDLMVDSESYIEANEPPLMPVTLLSNTLPLFFLGQQYAEFVSEEVDLAADTTNYTLRGTMHVTNFTHYSLLASTSAQQPNVTITSSGFLSFRVLGFLSFSDIKYQDSIVMPGMSGLPNSKITSFGLFSPDGKRILTEIHMEMENPSYFEVNPLGDLNFDIFVLGHRVSTSHARDQVLELGVNRMVLLAELEPGTFNDSNPGAVAMFSNYMGQRVSKTLALPTAEDAASFTMFLPSVQALALEVDLPGSPEQLLRGGLGRFDVTSILARLFTRFRVTVPFRLALSNPMNVTAEVTSMNFQIQFKGTQVMQLLTKQYYDNTPLILRIPPLSTVLCQELPVTASIGGPGALYQLLVSFFSTLGGGFVQVDVKGEMELTLGQLHLTLPYEASNVPFCPGTDTSRCDAYFNNTDIEPL